MSRLFTKKLERNQLLHVGTITIYQGEFVGRIPLSVIFRYVDTFKIGISYSMSSHYVQIVKYTQSDIMYVYDAYCLLNNKLLFRDDINHLLYQ